VIIQEFLCVGERAGATVLASVSTLFGARVRLAARAALLVWVSISMQKSLSFLLARCAQQRNNHLFFLGEDIHRSNSPCSLELIYLGLAGAIAFSSLFFSLSCENRCVLA